MIVDREEEGRIKENEADSVSSVNTQDCQGSTVMQEDSGKCRSVTAACTATALNYDKQ